MEGRRPEGHITVPRNTKMEETTRRQRRTEGGVFSGRPGPIRGFSAIDGMEFSTCSHVFHQFSLFVRPLHGVHKRVMVI
jgi:hypothetical protein